MTALIPTDYTSAIDVHADANGVLVTSSRNVAAVFGKEHRNVVRDIRAITEKCSPEFNALNFEPVEYKDVKGEQRPEYLLTKDGLVMLIMGYTGPKAMAFKEAYIKRFNEMEAALKQQKQGAARQLPELLAGAEIVLAAAGLTGNQLALALDKSYKAHTGASALVTCGVQLATPKQEVYLTPTQIADELNSRGDAGHWSARLVNQYLFKFGYQCKKGKSWEPTEKGLAAGAMLLDTGKAHSNGTPVTQLKWRSSIVAAIHSLRLL